MSEEKRFRQDYTVEGWPIADREGRTVLSLNDLVKILNDLDRENRRLVDLGNIVCSVAAKGIYIVKSESDRKAISDWDKNARSLYEKSTKCMY